MKGFTNNIEESTLNNTDYRKVLYTSKHMQLVLMSLKPQEEIGSEKHSDIDQFFCFETGNGKCTIDSTGYVVKAGDIIIVPAGATHNVTNTDDVAELKPYTIYAPPNHEDKLVRSTKKEADTKGIPVDGKTTE
jgi:mannose-6-phosphate isomerase-like protein (cupin superfamily)